MWLLRMTQAVLGARCVPQRALYLPDIVGCCQINDQISLQLAAEAAAQYDQLSSDNEGLASTRSAHDNVAAATSKAIQDQVDKQAEGLSKEQAK